MLDHVLERFNDDKSHVFLNCWPKGPHAHRMDGSPVVQAAASAVLVEAQNEEFGMSGHLRLRCRLLLGCVPVRARQHLSLVEPH